MSQDELVDIVNENDEVTGQIITDDEFILGDEADSFDFFTLLQIEEELKNMPDKYGNAFKFVYNKFYINH